MKNQLRKFFSILPSGLILFLLLAQPVSAQTKEWGGVCTGTQITGGETVATVQGLECLLANLLMIFITVIGLVGFIMLIVASFRYLLSGGNAKGTEAARNSITYAVIGLVVALSSFFIINLIAQFTGISLLTNFKIPTSDTQWE